MKGQNLRLPLLDEPRPDGLHPNQPCPVCGQDWQPWANSRLPCHGRCLLTTEAATTCLEMWQDNHTAQVIAASLGVTIGVIKSTLHNRFSIVMR